MITEEETDDHTQWQYIVYTTQEVCEEQLHTDTGYYSRETL